ncbi:acyl-homoserine-lactone synthase [Salinarimonas ramus]|uniref:Acyl-homoserine-lactone synthase n=1 Tax=Salinarimonas ramus TaxID=690164 RepID=A0A917Q9C5_9HYPH|nr:acyl-homoserine-lactone synthase [Salinarimonas ramus]GGK36767.1 isovaleryl-homoserine lactone synthase [Salinarimonas ramus]
MAHVQIINSSNSHLFEDLLEQTYRLRHQVFVEERGWRDLARPDGREIDQFDDEAATYLIAVDGDRVVGGQRLYPSTRPHMMSEVFSHLVQRDLPVGPDIVEVTRYFVAKERRFGRTDCMMLAAVMEYCLDEGISAMTAVVEMWWLPRWQQAGFVTRPLGLPVEIEGQDCLAVEILVREETLARVSRLAGLKGSVLRRTGLATDEAALRLSSRQS